MAILSQDKLPKTTTAMLTLYMRQTEKFTEETRGERVINGMKKERRVSVLGLPILILPCASLYIFSRILMRTVWSKFPFKIHWFEWISLLGIQNNLDYNEYKI